MATKTAGSKAPRVSTRSSEEAPLTHERLREVLRYEPEEGLFVWRWTMSSKATAGSVAGSLDGKGYRRISIDGKSYGLHRLVWFYIHGSWPIEVLDHKDRDKLNNRPLNLRDVTQSVNQWNRSTTSGRDHLPMGVCLEARTGKFYARITGLKASAVQTHLGTFLSAEEASSAYQKAQLLREKSYEQSSR